MILVSWDDFLHDHSCRSHPKFHFANKNNPLAPQNPPLTESLLSFVWEEDRM